MAVLPNSTEFTASSVTEAQFKTAITGMRDFLSGLLGADGTAATARATLGIGTFVTSVGATAPVVSSGGSAPTISMAAASAGANGYMSAGYAAKLDGIQAGATAGPVYDAGVNGLGVIAMMINKSGGSVSSGATIAGSSLQYLGIDSASGSFTSHGVAAGTWRNITAGTIATNTAGTFQRVA